MPDEQADWVIGCRQQFAADPSEAGAYGIHTVAMGFPYDSEVDFAGGVEVLAGQELSCSCRNGASLSTTDGYIHENELGCVITAENDPAKAWPTVGMLPER